MTALLWSLAAWCGLALAVPRHHAQAFGSEGSAAARRRWRCVGVMAILMVLARAVLTEGWAMGTLHAVAALVVAGAVVPGVLAWAPRRCAALAAAAAALGAWLAA